VLDGSFQGRFVWVSDDVWTVICDDGSNPYGSAANFPPDENYRKVIYDAAKEFGIALKGDATDIKSLCGELPEHHSGLGHRPAPEVKPPVANVEPTGSNRSRSRFKHGDYVIDHRFSKISKGRFAWLSDDEWTIISYDKTYPYGSADASYPGKLREQIYAVAQEFGIELVGNCTDFSAIYAACVGFNKIELDSDPPTEQAKDPVKSESSGFGTLVAMVSGAIAGAAMTAMSSPEPVRVASPEQDIDSDAQIDTDVQSEANA
jgi:hypothetical protein